MNPRDTMVVLRGGHPGGHPVSYGPGPAHVHASHSGHLHANHSGHVHANHSGHIHANHTGHGGAGMPHRVHPMPTQQPQIAPMQRMGQGHVPGAHGAAQQRMMPTQNGSAAAPKHDAPQMQHPVSNINTACVLTSHTYRLLSQGHPIRYPRAPTPQRADCYHQLAGGAGYMSAAVPPAAPGMAAHPAGMRAPHAHANAPSQSPATTQPMQQQQELKQQPMSSHQHSYAPTQPAPQQPRPQHYAAPYRQAATPRPPHTHSPDMRYFGDRGPTHQHSQLYQGSNAAAAAPIMYGPIMYPQHGVMTQQYHGAPQRPACYPQNLLIHQNAYHCLGPYQQNQPQQTYYYPASQPLLTGGLASPAPAVPRPINVAPPGPPFRKKRLHAITIKDPKTGEDVCAGLFADNQTLSGESSERQTPQPETNSVAEEFSRMVIETLNKGNAADATKGYPKVETLPASGHHQAPPSFNNSNTKTEALPHTEAKPPADIGDTPVVSAMSDSPVIVPKLCSTVKPKSGETPLDSKRAKPKSAKSDVATPVEENETASMQSVASATTLVPSSLETVPTGAEHSEPDPVPVPAPAAPLPVPMPAPDPAPGADVLERPLDAVLLEPTPQEAGTDEPVRRDASPCPQVKVEPATAISGNLNGPYTVPIAVDESLADAKTIPESETIVLPILEIAVVDEAPPPTTVDTLQSEAATQTLAVAESTVESAAQVEEEIEFTSTQAKLHQSITSCNKLKPKEAAVKTTEADTASVFVKAKTPSLCEEDKNVHNKNELTTCDLNRTDVVDNVKTDDDVVKTADDADVNIVKDENVDEPISMETVEIETDTVAMDEPQGLALKEEMDTKTEPMAPQAVKTAEKPELKYHYKKNQWSPLNPTGSKIYDRDFLLQLQEDPLSKKKPDNLHALSAVAKSKNPESLLVTPIQNLSRINSESFLPQFAKGPIMTFKGPGRDRERDSKKSNVMSCERKSSSMIQSKGGSGGVLLQGPVSSAGGTKVFHVSLQLRGDVKLNESENAWKPTRRIQNSQLASEDQQTREIYRKFRGILNKLTPENFATLLEKVKRLEINTQERLEGVIGLTFEKAIEEPNFSVTYAAMCEKLSKLMVLVDNSTDQYVNFRSLIISKCQAQFETTKVQERVVELEKEIELVTDAAKRKEINLLLNEENRKIRMRSVGNVRFIGELYKLEMLTSTIMLYCLNHLIDKLEEEKLECLCKLLTTIGQNLEKKVNRHVGEIFAKMQEIVDQRKINKISSRVRFMLQDVIELRRRKWTAKSIVTEAQPKTLDQVQKEAEYQQRQIEIMNTAPAGRDYRGGREETARGKRGGENRRGGSSNFDNWSQGNQRAKYTVDTSKLKAATNSNKNLSTIKLGPPQHAWNHGSGARPSSLSSVAVGQTSTNNMYSALENANTDPSSLRAGGSKPPTSPLPRSSSGSRSASERSEPPPMARSQSPSPDPLTDAEHRLLRSILDLHLLNPNQDEFAHQLKEKFNPMQHSSVVGKLYSLALEKSSKTYRLIANTILHAVLTHAISRVNFIIGFTVILEEAPDWLIDYPKVYEYLAIFIAPFLIKQQISLYALTDGSDKIILEQQGSMFLGCVLLELESLQGASFTKAKWIESGCYLKDWMSEEEALKFAENERLAYVFEDDTPGEQRRREPSPPEIQASLLLLMNLDKSCDMIHNYIRECVGKATSEDWFMRALIQAVCEHALFGRAGEGTRTALRLNADRMSKYIHLVNEYGDDKELRDTNCLLGIQLLLHRLEHPKGVTLEIFQYLSDHYIIQREGFLAFEKADLEKEGKGVMMKALVSFYTNIQEVDNEDSCSED